jgi:hypothetical protein
VLASDSNIEAAQAAAGLVSIEGLVGRVFPLVTCGVIAHFIIE